jgi:hypothetical protein
MRLLTGKGLENITLLTFTSLAVEEGKLQIRINIEDHIVERTRKDQV